MGITLHAASDQWATLYMQQCSLFSQILSLDFTSNTDSVLFLHRKTGTESKDTIKAGPPPLI